MTYNFVPEALPALYLVAPFMTSIVIFSDYFKDIAGIGAGSNFSVPGFSVSCAGGFGNWQAPCGCSVVQAAVLSIKTAISRFLYITNDLPRDFLGLLGPLTVFFGDFLRQCVCSRLQRISGSRLGQYNFQLCRCVELPFVVIPLIPTSSCRNDHGCDLDRPQDRDLPASEAFQAWSSSFPMQVCYSACLRLIRPGSGLALGAWPHCADLRSRYWGPGRCFQEGSLDAR